MLRARVSGKLDERKVCTLCPVVFECAFAGDEVASGIIVNLGRELALYATAAIQRFAMERMAFDVVLSGSVFKGHGPLLIDTVTQAIHAAAPCARIVRPRFEPVVGALLLALDTLAVAESEPISHNLQRTQPSPAFFDTL